MRVALLLPLLCLAACGNQRAEREAALRPFVGGTEENLIRAIGVPNRTFETSGHRFLAYNEARISVIPGFPGFYPPFQPLGYFTGIGYGAPQTVVQQVCETTFEVDQGHVLGFALHGNGCG